MLIEHGRLLLLSGQVPFDAMGNISGAYLASQLDQVFQNISKTLQAAGVGFDAIARLTIYVRDYEPSLLPIICTVRGRWTNAERPPESALIGVASLFHPHVLVETEDFAVAPG